MICLSYIRFLRVALSFDANIYVRVSVYQCVCVCVRERILVVFDGGTELCCVNPAFV